MQRKSAPSAPRPPFRPLGSRQPAEWGSQLAVGSPQSTSSSSQETVGKKWQLVAKAGLFSRPIAYCLVPTAFCKLQTAVGQS